MKILHFMGEGKGMMSGISEYVIITENDEKNEQFKAPGFYLESETEIDDLPTSFPINQNLIPE